MSRGFSPWRDLPAIAWLAAIPVVAFAHPWIPEPRWLLLHLLLLGAVTHSIVVWSQHFTDALLHVPSTPRPRLLALLAFGSVAVMAGTQTAVWPLTLAGAAAVASAVLWHAVRLTGQLRRALPARFAGVVRYYVAAAALLPVGATLGVLLARGLPDPWHERVLLAHVAVNLLGWVGLTVAGTVVTLWPTMLRTRLGAGSDAALQRALPVLLAGVLVTAGASVLGLGVLAAAGLAAYVGGAVLLGVPLVEAARRKPPTSHPAWSLGAGLLWLLGCLVAWAAILATSGEGAGEGVGERFGVLVPFLAVGFAAQVLLGAMGYLIPMALGGGATAVRAANEVLDRGGAFRVVAVNLGLLVCLLPAPSAVVAGCSLVVLLALAASLPLVVLAIRASRRRRPTARVGGRGRSLGSAVAGASVVLLVVAAGVAVDPGALGSGNVVSAAAGVAPTGHTTTVRVEAADMRFVPAEVDVPAGDRLVIEVVNTDNQLHDLVLETGVDSGRLAPGEETSVDVGVVGRALDGWCSLVGHRQMGMTLRVNVTDGDHHLHHLDTPESDHDAVDAELPPLRGHGPQTHRVTMTVGEVEREVAPGVTQRLWTYDGQAPGPVLHGRVGDRFVVTLVNDGTIGHSIDFHAGALAPDRPMRTLEPGQSLTYRFTARRAGVWMYHCSTMPMSVHIANGMFGAVVIEPRDLAPVDRTYLLVQSEQYRGPETVDADKIAAEDPDAVVFNGYPNQYDADPLRVDAGDRLRIWVLDAGPNRATSFHVVGGQFTTTYAEGAYLLREGPEVDGGAQALALMPAQGGFVELELDEPGHYPFVSHVMVDAERGAHGVIEVAEARDLRP
ncbi:multicopper oxidase domain-containing protein [Nocardioides sp. SR21]|uniref:multicopper oxidase domain-containing protein n=1 Tax=Nocardioides sp. SR21 TaxID=2919501 RepID=UPI001FAA51E1|nr:multicopper oxidase domain-containing protein [Nocardioides sp. SR21]